VEDIIKLVTKKAGISPDQAKSAVQTVLKFLKDKLPGPVADQVEGVLSGKSSAQDVTGTIGGLLGKKKG
jgi:uncharacterized protein (DUF2267 family)